MTFGLGAAIALQLRVASLPSNTVKFCGPFSIIGPDAVNHRNFIINVELVSNVFSQRANEKRVINRRLQYILNPSVILTSSLFLYVPKNKLVF